MKISIDYTAVLFVTLAMLTWPTSCAADESMAKALKDLEHGGQIDLGLPFETVLDDINLDPTQRFLVLQMVAPSSAKTPVTVRHWVPIRSRTSAVPQVSASEIIGLNNEGVKALIANNFLLAILRFEAALKLDPGYNLARDNLAIAHNNYGLVLRKDPPAALKQFHHAQYLNHKNVTTLQNVEGIIKVMGKDPKNFGDRVALGDRAKLDGDLESAFVEYVAALQIKDDAQIRSKLSDVYRHLEPADKATGRSKNVDLDPLKAINQAINGPRSNDVDFGPYMADLQRKIKQAWYPPKGEESRGVIVTFTVHQDGALSNLKLTKSAGLKIADDSALRAVEHAAPFARLPAGSDEHVDIQFNFDYNVFAANKHLHVIDSQSQTNAFDMKQLLRSDTSQLWRNFYANFYRY